MRHLLLAFMLAWFVVRGFVYPPTIISGPFGDWASCQRMADFLNRQYLAYDYRCENLVY